MNRLGFALVTPLFGSVATRNRKSFFPPYVALGGVIACMTLLCFLSYPFTFHGILLGHPSRGHKSRRKVPGV